jgi:hypothetical protein
MDDDYYHIEDFKESNKIFEDYLSKCNIIKEEKKEHSKFVISTLTVVSNISDKIDIVKIYKNLQISSDIIYIESGKNIKGEKKKKKYKKNKKDCDKRKLSKGCPFSNQISIGIICKDKNHKHNNPISIKLFRNGRIQLTGCKDDKEIEIIYNKLYDNINEYIENMLEYKDLKIKSEMINGTFNTNYKIDLDKLNNKIIEKYSYKEIYINNQKKASLTLYLKIFSIYDERKKKFKDPSIFIYNSGSINLIAIDKEMIMKSYKFIDDFLNKNYNDIVETKLNLKI